MKRHARPIVIYFNIYFYGGVKILALNAICL